MRKLPKYVKMGAGSYLRLLSPNDNRIYNCTYWVDAGKWGVDVMEVPTMYDPVDFSEINFKSISTMDGLNNQKIIECSEKEWFARNSGYVPTGYVLENGSKVGYSNEEEDYDLDGIFESDEPVIDFMYLLI